MVQPRHPPQKESGKCVKRIYYTTRIRMYNVMRIGTHKTKNRANRTPLKPGMDSGAPKG